MTSLRTIFAVAGLACRSPIATLRPGDLSVGAQRHR